MYYSRLIDFLSPFNVLYVRGYQCSYFSDCGEWIVLLMFRKFFFFFYKSKSVALSVGGWEQGGEGVVDKICNLSRNEKTE